MRAFFWYKFLKPFQKFDEFKILNDIIVMSPFSWKIIYIFIMSINFNFHNTPLPILKLCYPFPLLELRFPFPPQIIF